MAGITDFRIQAGNQRQADRRAAIDSNAYKLGEGDRCAMFLAAFPLSI